MSSLYLTILDFKKSKKPKKSNFFFLGPWFNSGENFKESNILNYHWSNLNKIDKDYKFLFSLKKKIFYHLKKKLNEIHNLNYSTQSWTIILEPFLQNYLTVLFDRWEIIKSIKKKRFDVNFYKYDKSKNNYPDSFNFINRSFEDDWNQQLFQEIIIFKDLKNLRINQIKTHLKKKQKITKNINYNLSIRDKFLDILMNFISIFKKNFDFYFADHSFSKKFFLKIHLLNNSLPFLIKNPLKLNFNYYPSKKNIKLRKTIFDDYKFESSNKKFEHFFISKLTHELPNYTVEDLNFLTSKVAKLRFKPKLYLVNINIGMINFLKHGAAKKTNEGTKLITMEHGGSFPYKYNYFNFEEDSAYLSIRWFKPLYKKHFQITSFYIYNNLINSIKNFNYKFLKRKNCSIIYDRFFNYTLTMAQPCAGSDYLAFKNLKKFEKNLNLEIKKNLKIKFHPRDHFNMMNTQNIFARYRINDKNIINTYKKSRIIICFYPETTFSEALSHNIPTILFIPKGIYKLCNETKVILSNLKKSKIFFDDPEKMALHLNKIWHNPIKWWNSHQTTNSKNLIKKDILGIKKGVTLIERWNYLLNKILR
jgi:putative transferase (TIGR04331 family)